MAAAQAELPVWCPGWEDSTCGNIIVSLKLKGIIDDYPIKSGLEQMETLVDWYREQDASREAGVGFFQLGGGIAGDYSVRRNSDTRTIRHVLKPIRCVSLCGGRSVPCRCFGRTWRSSTSGCGDTTRR